MPDRSKVMAQTKRDTLALQVGGQSQVGTHKQDGPTAGSSKTARVSYRSSWPGK